ncbi:DNA methyltransferase family protein [Enterobacter cloacae]|uniref:hypothetical protein n=1 Tax=Enterobacter cloacae TaxID=550 RepID=UPI001D08867E|nr:hypothetical protein [Enterobacter cloacae]
MTKMNPYSAEFIKLFNELETGHERFTVFKNFVERIASCLHGSYTGNEVAGTSFSTIASRYSDDDLRRVTKLLALICAALDAKKGDFLGEVFNLLGLGKSRPELTFIPYEVALSSANEMFSKLDELMKQQHHIALLDMSCGAGSMAIAIAEVFKQRGYNVHQQLFIQCVDVNPIVTAMCYIQLTVLGIPAEVHTCNSIRLDKHMARHTPAFYAFDWMQRLQGEKPGLHS